MVAPSHPAAQDGGPVIILGQLRSQPLVNQPAPPSQREHEREEDKYIPHAGGTGRSQPHRQGKESGCGSQGLGEGEGREKGEGVLGKGHSISDLQGEKLEIKCRTTCI